MSARRKSDAGIMHAASPAPATRRGRNAAIDFELPPALLQGLFDPLPDVVFFVKDAQCRYVHVNQTLVQRLGQRGREDIIGRSVVELYPPTLSATYIAQDRRVLAGETIEHVLELQLYPNRRPGWCLTFKQPLRSRGRIVGLIGISRDLGQPDSQHSSFARLQATLAHMQAHFDAPLRIQALAEIAGVSVSQLERQFRRVFQITPQQMLTKLRIEAAMRMLHGNDSIAAIGQACGFSDQSAFARQFKATVGMPPRDYRALAQA
ncbi:AraC-like DNA-binding protein [Luteimonas sp. J16]|jgi:AraC-like DNA-binding protein|nr:AraC-like DNA-binding protein [Luteimonas sp. J16]